jgi:hypothetical protein
VFDGKTPLALPIGVPSRVSLAAASFMFLQNESHFCLRDLNIGIPLFLLSLSKEVLKKASSATKSVVVVVVRLSLLLLLRRRRLSSSSVRRCRRPFVRARVFSLPLSLFRKKGKKSEAGFDFPFFFVKTSS